MQTTTRMTEAQPANEIGIRTLAAGVERAAVVDDDHATVVRGVTDAGSHGPFDDPDRRGSGAGGILVEQGGVLEIARARVGRLALGALDDVHRLARREVGPVNRHRRTVGEPRGRASPMRGARARPEGPSWAPSRPSPTPDRTRSESRRAPRRPRSCSPPTRHPGRTRRRSRWSTRTMLGKARVEGSTVEPWPPPMTVTRPFGPRAWLNASTLDS